MAAQAHVRFSPNSARTANMNIENYLFYLGPRFRAFSVEVCKVPRLPRKIRIRHPRYWACHAKSSSCTKSKFHKTKVSSRRPSAAKTTPVTKNDFRNHLSFRPPPASVSPVTQNDIPEINMSQSPALATKNGHSSRNEHRTPKK